MEKMEEVFSKLNKRIIDSLEKTDLEKINYTLKSIKDSTIITGSGGSYVVADYASKILNSKNAIITACHNPRDMKYMELKPYSNVISCSYSGKGLSVDQAFCNNLNKYLFSSVPNERVNNITYDIVDPEKSFVSVANTLIPITILLNYYLENDIGAIKRIINKENEDYEKIFSTSGYIDTSCASEVEIFYGYESSTTAKFLESAFVEAGLAIPLMHDKYDYCHGRFTHAYVKKVKRKKDNCAIFVDHDNARENQKPLDRAIVESMRPYFFYGSYIVRGYADDFINEFYMLLRALRLISEYTYAFGMDISQVPYDSDVVRLYRYNGQL